ncbi:MAG TPA: GspE/PulE family protein [Candidatus Paceibacterota bacterium]|jgi:type IV pilus assembly protein PilB|nr:GspE/PulE family protein [Candidatus Paceibacterota bacterium]
MADSPLPPTGDLQAKLAKLRKEGEERAAERLAGKLGLPYADLSKMPVSLDAVRVIAENSARDAKVAGIEVRPHKIAVGASNPELPATKAALKALQAQGYEVKTFVVSPSGLDIAWRLYKFVKPVTETITGKVNITQERIEELRGRLTSIDAIKKEFAGLDFSKVSPVTIIEIMLGGAFAMRASDIHTEAEEKKAKFRFRIDGLLHDVFDDVPPRAYEALVSRIKLLSGMKLNVRDDSQDGRFTINVAGKEIEMRVSVIPAEFGETIVMRILDPSATLVTLAQLGLREDNLEIVKRQLEKPNGLILNTGPTGSGKTTTLYAFMRTINDPEIKIITLEDPIEYRLEGIEQTQVDEEAGYTFANGLRAIVRQDPDIILVGEIRDLETGDIALQAALTGHLVLSTLHTNDAVGAVPRLINLGVKAVSIGPALSLAIAQRLVRVLCPDCKKAAAPDAAFDGKVKKFFAALPAKVDKKKYEGYKVYDAVGCTKCNGIGYKGRVGIFEFLEGGPDLEKTILREASEVALREVAARQEMVTMQQDGILKVLEGKTTLAEVESVTGQIAW